MAFPQIVGSATSSRANSAVDDSVTLPSSIAAGDLILVFHFSDGALTRTFPSPWVEIKDTVVASSLANIGIAYLIASGGETSVTVTKSASERFSAIAVRISAASWHGTTPPEVSAGVTGTSANPNPDALDPANWDVEDTLWIAACCYDNSGGGNAITAYPYAANNLNSPDVSSAGRGGIASSENAVASENPGTFTITSDEWWAGTVAVRPAGVGVKEEDSDSWFAGAMRSFVAVPIASTLATVALASSLAFGYQQQTEEIFAQPQAAQGSAITLRTAIQRPVFLPIFGGNDDVPIAAAPVGLDDDWWPDYRPASQVIQGLYLPDPEEIPAGVLFGQADEDYWQVYIPPLPQPSFVYLPDPEQVPAGSLFGVPEEDAWQAPVLQPTVVQALSWVDEEIVPQPVVFTPEEAYWEAAPAIQPQPPQWVLFADEEFVTPLTPLPVAEEYWWPGWWETRPPVVTTWTVEDETPPAPAGASVGSATWLRTAPRQSVVLLSWGADEVQVAPVPLPIEEESWQRFHTVQYPRPRILLGDDALSPLGDEEPWQVYTPPLSAPRFLYLPDPESLPAGALFGVPSEDGWWPSIPKAVEPFVAQAWDDQIPQLFAGADEDGWQPAVPQTSQPYTLVWVTDDEIIPQPAPFSPEEDAWQLWMPVSSTSSFVYLPDAEDVPAGNLSGVPEQDAWWPLVQQSTRVQPVVWISDEEIVPQAPALSLDEEYWLIFPLRVEFPSWSQWFSDDQIVSTIEEAYWLQFNQSPAQVLGWPVLADDEIVPQPVVPEDDPWIMLPTVIQAPSVGPWPWFDHQEWITPQFVIAGVTRNCAGAPLGLCTVLLFRTSDNILIGSTVSDVNGVYSFNVSDGTTKHFLVAYFANAPDVAGTTRNDIVGTA